MATGWRDHASPEAPRAAGDPAAADPRSAGGWGMRAPDLRRANWEWELGEEEEEESWGGWPLACLAGWFHFFISFSSLSKMGSLVREKVL